MDFCIVDKSRRPAAAELQAAAAPLLALLNEYYDPMCYAVVTEGRVEIVRAEQGAPLPVRD